MDMTHEDYNALRELFTQEGYKLHKHAERVDMGWELWKKGKRLTRIEWVRVFTGARCLFQFTACSKAA